MSKHIAIAIGQNELRAVWMRSGALRWHARATLLDACALDGALRTLLSSAPRALARARATIVLSPHWVQTKQPRGLPSIKSRRLVTQLLRENEQAFFLWTGRATTVVAHVAPNGAVWGAAFDTEFLDVVVRVMRSARLRVVEIAPSVAAIAAAFPGQSMTWRDGDTAFQVRGGRDGLVDLRRIATCESVEPLPSPAALRAIGAEAEHFVPVYAAATLRRRLPLAWRPSVDPTRLRLRTRLIRAAACVAMLAAGAAAMLAPGIRAANSTRASERELRRLRGVQQELSSVQSNLGRVSEALASIAVFTAGRGQLTRTLGALSQEIPESTAILDIRVDSAEGSFAAIAPNIADVLPALVDVTEIAAPQIVGSVTRETIAGARLERAAFRFRRPHAARTRSR